MYFLLSDGESPRLDKNTEVELVMKPRHPTSIGNMLVIEPFPDPHIYPTYSDVPSRNFLQKAPLTQ